MRKPKAQIEVLESAEFRLKSGLRDAQGVGREELGGGRPTLHFSQVISGPGVLGWKVNLRDPG